MLRERFAGKVVLITGASSGMGAVEARRFAEEGAMVLIADILDEQGVIYVEKLIALGLQAEFVHLDVTSTADWERVIAHAKNKFGHIDILVNNAGVNSNQATPFLEESELDRVFAIDVKGPIFGIQSVAPLMKERGGGAIVNIGSTVGLGGHIFGAYSVAKWAVRGVTKNAALSLSNWGIRVNSVCPGGVVTPMTAHLPLIREMTQACPMDRCGQIDEIAAAVLFLASDEASYITGIDLPVDGGFTELGAYGQMLDSSGTKERFGLK